MIMAVWKNLMWKTERFSLKNWYFQTAVLEKTLESPLDHKAIKLVNPKGNQPWVFIERPDAEAEAPILWSPDAKSQLIGEDPGKDWRQEKKGTTGWDGCMASLIQWTWVWANSRRQWRTENPGVLQFMGVTNSWTWLSDWTSGKYQKMLIFATSF